MLNMKDIAKLAGVSTATVSRVINNDPRVRKETRQEVEKIIEKFGYRRNLLARKLAMKRTSTIGVLLSDITNPFYSEIARGIEDEARQGGYTVMFGSTDNNSKIQQEYIDLFLEQRVDGIMFGSVSLEDPDVERLFKEDFPFVLINRKVDTIKTDFIVLDNVKGAYMITEYLIKLGHRRIGIIHGPLNYSTGVDRLRGYKEALWKHAIKDDSELMKPGDFQQESGYLAFKKFCQIKNPPTAVFASNDFMALGALEAASEFGVKIPEDIALVGFDDIDFVSFKFVDLTTVSQRKYEMGTKGTQLLIRKIENSGNWVPQEIYLEPKLIIRSSCGYRLKQANLQKEDLS
jgi:LacI family transcriptional regulator